MRFPLILRVGVLVMGTMLFRPSVLHSQEDACLRRTIELSLVNSKGQIINDLNPSEFAAIYRGKPVRILSIAQDHGPRRVVILLDASGSMTPVHQFAFDVADELLDQLPQGVQVMPIIFAKEEAATSTLTTDRQSVRQQLKTLRDDRRLPKSVKKGGTALLQAIEGALSSFPNPQDGDLIYVISDGDDNFSNVNWRKLDEQLLQHKTRVFATRIHWVSDIIGIGSNNDFADIITATGGSAIVLALDFKRYEQQTYKESLRDSLGKKSRTALEIDMQVRLMISLDKMEIELPEPAQSNHHLDLRLAAPSPDLFLVYQHTLSACPAANAD